VISGCFTYICQMPYRNKMTYSQCLLIFAVKGIQPLQWIYIYRYILFYYIDRASTMNIYIFISALNSRLYILKLCIYSKILSNILMVDKCMQDQINHSDEQDSNCRMLDTVFHGLYIHFLRRICSLRFPQHEDNDGITLFGNSFIYFS
jgi:hypothetical protein